MSIGLPDRSMSWSATSWDLHGTHVEERDLSAAADRACLDDQLRGFFHGHGAARHVGVDDRTRAAARTACASESLDASAHLVIRDTHALIARRGGMVGS